MEKPLVAVWMLAYNHEKFIAQAIDSVLMQQTKFPYKIYLGEDCSTDGTRAICMSYAKKFPDKIELFLNEENNIQVNSDRIWDVCFGSGAKYIALLEGDDYWTSPNKLQTQADILDSNPDVAMCTHTVKVELTEEGRGTFWVPPKKADLKWVLLNGSIGATCSIMMRRFENGLPSWYKDIWGDWIIQILCAERGDIIGLQDCMGVYRKHEGGFTAYGEDKQRLISVFEFCLKRCNFLVDYVESKFKKYIQKHRSSYCNLNLAILYHQDGQNSLAIKNAIAAFSHFDIHQVKFSAFVRLVLVFVPFSRTAIRIVKFILSK